MTKIQCELFDFICQKFKTQKDKKEFDKFATKCIDLNGIVITPLYNKEGRLMSFIVDGNEAHQIIKDIEDRNGRVKGNKTTIKRAKKES
jgi:hypothetical protein